MIGPLLYFLPSVRRRGAAISVLRRMAFTSLSPALQRAARGATHAAWRLALCCALAACSVGPPYVKPAAPEAAGYTASPVPAMLAAQRLDVGAEVAPHWWEQFGSLALDRLVERALEKNPGLEAAQHTLEQARYELEAARGIFSPQVSVGAGL